MMSAWSQLWSHFFVLPLPKNNFCIAPWVIDIAMVLLKKYGQSLIILLQKYGQSLFILLQHKHFILNLCQQKKQFRFSECFEIENIWNFGLLWFRKIDIQTLVSKHEEKLFVKFISDKIGFLLTKQLWCEITNMFISRSVAKNYQ